MNITGQDKVVIDLNVIVAGGDVTGGFNARRAGQIYRTAAINIPGRGKCQQAAVCL